MSGRPYFKRTNGTTMMETYPLIRTEKDDCKLRLVGNLIVMSIDKIDIIEFPMSLLKGIPLNKIGDKIEELLAEEPEWLIR